MLLSPSAGLYSHPTYLLCDENELLIEKDLWIRGR